MANRTKNQDVVGHRARLRERFRSGGAKALADYELLELLLTFAMPRRDTKPTAKDLLRRFGTFAGVLDQPAEVLAAIPGLGPQSATMMSAVRAAMARYLEEQLDAAPALQTPEDVVAFARVTLGAKQREGVLLLCLNDANRLLHHALVGEGTVNRTAVHAREVLKEALVHNATRLVLIHNHPSGDPTPSDDDHRMTRQIERLAGEFDIALVDHLIVTPRKAFSLKTGKLL